MPRGIPLPLPRSPRARLFLAAVAGVLGLGGVAVAIIVLSESPFSVSDPPPHAVATGPGQSHPPVPVLRSLPPEVIQSFRDSVGSPPLPVVYGPPPPKPQEGSWAAVPAAARASAMGPIGTAVGRELNELHDKVGVCFDEDVQARHGGQIVSAEKEFAALEDSAAPVLMLQLEAGHDEVRIVDAPVEVQANAQDGLIACAQGVLRGRSLAAPGARPGKRYRLMYQLIP